MSALAAPNETPKPGTPGGKIISEAERERQANPDPGPASETPDEKVFVAEAEKLAGKPIAQFTEADYIRLPIKLIAKNQTVSTELSVELKDPMMACRWINFKTKGGQRVEQARFRGFIPCTKDDVAACHATATDSTGALTMGDLVLMKISKARLFSGYYKDNADKARYRVSQQMSKPFSVNVPGVDNGSNGTHPYTITSSTELVDAQQARSLAFGR